MVLPVKMKFWCERRMGSLVWICVPSSPSRTWILEGTCIIQLVLFHLPDTLQHRVSVDATLRHFLVNYFCCVFTVLFCRAASLMWYRLAYGPCTKPKFSKNFKLLIVLADMKWYGFIKISWIVPFPLPD